MALLTGCSVVVLSSHIAGARANDGQPDRVRIPATSLILGSSLEQIVQATEACSLQASSACSLDEYSPELSSGARAYVPSFWMDRHEVSVRKYFRCVQLGHCRAPRYQNTTSVFLQADWPVVLVSFDDAAHYCATQGGALPSEQQYEAAAGGPQGRVYPWGNHFHSRLSNYGTRRTPFTDPRDGFELLAPTLALPDGRTPQGVQHLAGNVAEWTSSAMAPHDATARPQAARPPSGPRHVVVKGGSFLTLPVDQRVQARRPTAPDDVAVDVGFRCVYPSLPSP